MTDWVSVKDRLPQAKQMVLAYEAAFDSMSMAFRLPNTEEFINAGDYYALDAVTHWMPLPRTPGGDPRTKQQLVDEYAREHLCATCEWKNDNICTLPRCMKMEERSKNERKTAQPR